MKIYVSQSNQSYAIIVHPIPYFIESIKHQFGPSFDTRFYSFQNETIFDLVYKIYPLDSYQLDPLIKTTQQRYVVNI